jgi:putative transposase
MREISLGRRGKMPRKKLAAEQIVTKLRQIEVMQGQGKSIAAACREAGITEQSSGTNA